VTDPRDELHAEHQLAADWVTALTEELGRIVDSATGVNIDDEHDPEGTTIAFERAQVQTLLDQARIRLADLEAALVRTAEGSYGTCEICGTPIAAGRLAARPGVRTCIACAG
jgi:DnaK suppressor protein